MLPSQKKKRVGCLTLERMFSCCVLSPTNMAPEKGYLEDQFPLGESLSGAMATWERGYLFLLILLELHFSPSSASPKPPAFPSKKFLSELGQGFLLRELQPPTAILPHFFNNACLSSSQRVPLLRDHPAPLPTKSNVSVPDLACFFSLLPHPLHSSCRCLPQLPPAAFSHFSLWVTTSRRQKHHLTKPSPQCSPACKHPCMQASLVLSAANCSKTSTSVPSPGHSKPFKYAHHERSPLKPSASHPLATSASASCLASSFFIPEAPCKALNPQP